MTEEQLRELEKLAREDAVTRDGTTLVRLEASAEAVLALAAEVRALRAERSGAMARFLAGHWTRERPSAPGIYPTRGADGIERTPGFWALVQQIGEQLRVVAEEGGWFWSEPWPGMSEAER